MSKVTLDLLMEAIQYAAQASNQNPSSSNADNNDDNCANVPAVTAEPTDHFEIELQRVVRDICTEIASPSGSGYQGSSALVGCTLEPDSDDATISRVTATFRLSGTGILPMTIVHAWGLRGTLLVILQFCNHTTALKAVEVEAQPQGTRCPIAKQLTSIISAAAAELFRDGKWNLSKTMTAAAASSAAIGPTAPFQLSPAKAKIYEELCASNFSEEEAFQRALMANTIEEALQQRCAEVSSPEQLEWVHRMRSKGFELPQAIKIASCLSSDLECDAVLDSPSSLADVREKLLYAKLTVLMNGTEAESCLIEAAKAYAGNASEIGDDHEDSVDVFTATRFLKAPKYLGSDQKHIFVKLLTMGFSEEHAAEAASYTTTVEEALEFQTMAVQGEEGANVYRQLLDLGFDTDTARAAVALNPTSVEAAANAALEIQNVPRRKSTRRAVQGSFQRSQPPPRQQPAAAARSSALAAPQPDIVGVNRHAVNYDPKQDPNKHFALVLPPGRTPSIVDYIVALVEKRLPTLAQYCTQCDLPHLCFSSVVPVICTRQACVRRRNDELRDMIRNRRFICGGTSPFSSLTPSDFSVLQLLIDFLVEAAQSRRCNDVLKPFPCIGAWNEGLYLDPDAPDYKKLLHLSRGMVAVDVHATATATTAPHASPPVDDDDDDDDAAIFVTRDAYQFMLLHWLHESNQCHLEFIVGDKKLFTSMNCSRMFMLIQAMPEREAAFSKHLQAPGASRRYAFHGSPAENWHSILRNQLKNASGTSLQVHGRAHGAGIYVAPAVENAIKYASGNFYCIALCEIAVDAEGTAISDHQWCWTIADESRVVTRFLFVYSSRPSLPGVLSTSEEFVADVELAKAAFNIA